MANLVCARLLAVRGGGRGIGGLEAQLAAGRPLWLLVRVTGFPPRLVVRRGLAGRVRRAGRKTIGSLRKPAATPGSDDHDRGGTDRCFVYLSSFRLIR